MVMRRNEAEDKDAIKIVRKADAVWFVGDNPIHMRSVLKDTPVWEAVQHVLKEGGLVVGVGGTELFQVFVVDHTAIFRQQLFGVGPH